MTTTQKNNIENIKTKIRDICYSIKLDLPEDERILENIDSLGLVELVIKLEDEFIPTKPLVSSDAFSKSKSPFRTVSTLADFICEVL